MINSSELLEVVDEHDNLMTPLPRRVVHEIGAWHRTAHIWIYNQKGEVLCQQRSLLKDVNAGYWEPFFGGHITAGTDPLAGALQEVEEELSLTFKPEDFQFVHTYVFHSPSGKDNEHEYRYICRWDGRAEDLAVEEEEVAKVNWISLAEVQKALEGKNSEPWTILGGEEVVLEAISKQVG